MSATVNQWLRRIPTWVVYSVGVLPPLWYFYLGVTGGLGAEPINALERLVGELAIQMLIVVLAVTPLRNWTGINLVKFRRAFGLLTFYYVAFHLAVWLFLDVQILSQIWADILKRPYITIGFAAFLLMIPAAVTSNNLSIRKMGPKVWKRVHQLTYASAFFGAVHWVWLAKGFQIEPLVYLTVILALLATRVKLPKRAAVA